MKWGTCHFYSMPDAVEYYAAYGYTRADVANKLVEGAIAIGKPEAKPGERVYVGPDGRYWIDDGV